MNYLERNAIVQIKQFTHDKEKVWILSLLSLNNQVFSYFLSACMSGHFYWFLDVTNTDLNLFYSFLLKKKTFLIVEFLLWYYSFIYYVCFLQNEIATPKVLLFSTTNDKGAVEPNLLLHIQGSLLLYKLPWETEERQKGALLESCLTPSRGWLVGRDVDEHEHVGAKIPLLSASKERCLLTRHAETQTHGGGRKCTFAYTAEAAATLTETLVHGFDRSDSIISFPAREFV